MFLKKNEYRVKPKNGSINKGKRYYRQNLQTIIYIFISR